MDEPRDDSTYADLLDLGDEIFEAARSSSQIKMTSNIFAWLRTAISKYYYAVFGGLVLFFSNDPDLKNVITKDGAAHWTLIKYCRENLPPHMASLGNELKVLHEARKHADYDYAEEYGASMAKVGICANLSRNIIQSIPDILANIGRKNAREIGLRLDARGGKGHGRGQRRG